MSTPPSPIHYRKGDAPYKACGDTINTKSKVTSDPDLVTCKKCQDALELWAALRAKQDGQARNPHRGQEEL